jgi:hypothetical protein
MISVNLSPPNQATRKWRRKPLKSLETDSEVAACHSAFQRPCLGFADEVDYVASSP